MAKGNLHSHIRKEHGSSQGVRGDHFRMHQVAGVTTRRNRSGSLPELAGAIFQLTRTVHGLTKTAAAVLNIACGGTKPGNLSLHQKAILTQVLSIARGEEGKSRKRHAKGARNFYRVIAARLAAILRLAKELDEQGISPGQLSIADDNSKRTKPAEIGVIATLSVPGHMAANGDRHATLVMQTNEGRQAAQLDPAAILSRQWRQVLALAPGMVCRWDVEYVHEMRVAIRRLRSYLRNFRKLLGQDPAKFDQSLRQLARELGIVRDLDVYLEFLGQYESAAPRQHRDFLRRLIASQQARRSREYRRLMGLMSTGRLKRLKASARAMGIAQGPRKPVRRQAGRDSHKLMALAAKLLRKKLKRVLRFDKPLTGYSPDRQHQLRILCKRLRYTAESFEAIYPQAFEAALITPAKKMQDLLGEVHDTHVFEQSAQAYSGRLARRNGGSTAPAGAFQSHLRRRRAKLLAQSQREWKAFCSGRKQTRELINSILL